MRYQQAPLRRPCFSGKFSCGLCLVIAMFLATGNESHAAINWDSQALGEVNMMPNQPLGAGTQWWFNPVNWSATEPGEAPPWYLPPTVNGTATTDVQINEGTLTLPGGEGVVYDPDNDPHYDDLDLGGSQTLGAEDLTYPAGYGPRTIEQMYISRNTTNHNLLTIKGDLELRRLGSLALVVGRSGSTGTAPEQQNLGRVNQLAGTVIVNGDLDVGGSETSGWGNGIYDYRGGTLKVQGNSELRLSAGGSAGAAGHGRLIVHNPTTGGHIRTRQLEVAAVGADGTSSPADGITKGVGIVEFHFENGGTRPIQVTENLVLNNGSPIASTSTRSARLDLVLNEAPCSGAACVPVNLGLIDVDFGDIGFGLITGSLSLGPTFSNASNPSEVYTDGSSVSATFGSNKYNWTIRYGGHITWSNADNSVVQSISGTGGTDVVLIGLSSEALPGVPGDYNGDGFVDAADYVAWRKTPSAFGGDPVGYNTWRQHFGESDGGSGGSGQVPEPASLLLVLLGAVAMPLRRRRGWMR
jgi:hypothetical protein